MLEVILILLFYNYFIFIRLKVLLKSDDMIIELYMAFLVWINVFPTILL